MSEPERSSTIERILQSISSIVTTGAFLGMVWLAVHIITHPDGAREVHRYLYSHYSNFVDPSVEVEIERSPDGAYTYEYSVSNGPFSLQAIREFMIAADNGSPVPHVQNWSIRRDHIMLGQRRIHWQSTTGLHDYDGIGRGESVSGFRITSRALPTIVEAHAGNRLRYNVFSGIVTNATTPAGRRVIRWTLGPSEHVRRLTPDLVIRRLRSDIARSSRLQWITDPVVAASISRTVDSVAAALENGDATGYVLLIDECLERARINEGRGITREGAALVSENLKWLCERLRSHMDSDS